MTEADASAPDPHAVEPKVLAIVAQLVRETHPGREHAVAMHSSLERDLELDSLARAELMLRISQAFHAELPTEALAQAQTPQDIVRFLGRMPQAGGAPEASVLEHALSCGVPDHAQTLVDVLEWHAERQPQRLHILLQDDQRGEQPLRYRDLLEAANMRAAGLIALGLQPRQTVALMLPTGQAYLACFFGVLMAGGIPVPIYPPARLSQVAEHLKRHARILSNAGAAFLITVPQAKPVAVMLKAAVPDLAEIVTDEELKSAPLPARHRPGNDDIAFLQYTSGSTGDPKGVTLTHANLLANIRALGQAVRVAPDDVFVSWLPLYHDMGLISAWLGSMYFGMPLVLMSPLAFLAQPARWLQAISRHRGTISGAPNFAYELCARNITAAAAQELDLSSWRLAFNGAEPVNPATLDAFADRFAACGLRREALAPVFGLAEASVGLTVPPPGRGPRIDVIRREPFISEGVAIPAAADDADSMRVACCGRPLPGHEIRIVDANEQELPERRIGRLEFRGPSATSGYYRNPEATAQLIHGAWLDSGDYAYIAQGELHITGRVKDLIKRGGRNIYPYDLEAAVGSLPGIRKGCVAAFASPDPASGTERLVVLAETRERDPSARESLRRRIHETALDVIATPVDDIVLAPPHSVLKTSSGKIRRLASRQAYERGEVGHRMAAPWLAAAHLAIGAALARAKLLARQAALLAYGIYAWAIFITIALPVGALIALMQKPAAGRRLARGAARTLFRLAALPLSAQGLERLPKRPHVLLINHASYLDAIVLTALLPAAPGYSYVAKRDFPRPLRALLAGLGTIFVERYDVARSTQDLEGMVDGLARGERLVVFPEGTFRREAGLKSFHTGAFLAAARTDTPVAVAGLRGTRAVLRAETRLPRRGPVEFEVGSVLLPAGRDWAAAADMSTMARKGMVALSGEFDSLA